MLCSEYKMKRETWTVTDLYARIILRLAALRDAVCHGARGQGLVEYAAILGFVAACMVVAELFLEPHIAQTLNNVANGFH